MSQLKLPKKPVPDWEQVRDEWVRAVEQLVTDVESWCRANDWPTRRIDKGLEESKIGEYVVPGLVIQVDFVKLMLEPMARFVGGADGALDLYRMPQYDNVAVVSWHGGDWQLRVDTAGNPDGVVKPLTADVFTDFIRRVV